MKITNARQASSGSIFCIVTTDEGTECDVRVDKRGRASGTCMGEPYRIGGRRQRECHHIRFVRKILRIPKEGN